MRMRFSSSSMLLHSDAEVSHYLLVIPLAEYGAAQPTQEKPRPTQAELGGSNSSSSRRHTDGGCGGAARRNAPDARLAGASGQREYGGSCTPQLAASCIGSKVPRHAFASSALPSGEGAAATLTTTEPRGGGWCGSGCGECSGRKPQVNLGPQIPKRRGYFAFSGPQFQTFSLQNGSPHRRRQGFHGRQ